MSKRLRRVALIYDARVPYDLKVSLPKQCGPVLNGPEPQVSRALVQRQIRVGDKPPRAIELHSADRAANRLALGSLKVRL